VAFRRVSAVSRGLAAVGARERVCAQLRCPAGLPVAPGRFHLSGLAGKWAGVETAIGGTVRPSGTKCSADVGCGDVAFVAHLCSVGTRLSQAAKARFVPREHPETRGADTCKTVW